MAWPTNPRPAKSIVVLRDQYNKKYPKRSKDSDGMLGDAAHALRQSDHNPDKNGVVKAIDITDDPDNGVDCDKESEILVRLNARRINYLIWKRRIWQAGTWKTYTGKNPHSEHMHISVNEASQDDTTPWKLEEDDMKLSNAAEVNLIWQANGVNRAPTEKEVKEALGRTLENYMEYFLQLPFVKANLAKVRFYEKDLATLEAVTKLIKGKE